MRFERSILSKFLLSTFCLLISTQLFAQSKPLVYEGTDGPGKGKHIVFLAGDHEYRGEQTCPMLARILAKHYGFKCTVLFSVDKKTGDIVPGSSHMPGTEALADADLAVMFLRFQNFPADQFQPIVDYLDRAGPIVGLRTSTHAFQVPKNSKFAKFDHKFAGDDYKGGFGRQVLGETWVSHYGRNHVMSTRLDIVESKKNHPILSGVTNPWTQSGGYWTDPMPGSEVLAMTQPLTTMKKDSAPAADKKPCPNAWTRTYTGKNGATGRVFTTTSGASEDIVDDDFRRMLVNSCFWAMGMEDKIKPDSNITMVGKYNPSTFQMNSNYYVGVKPLELAGWDSPIMPDKPLKKRTPRKKKNPTAEKPRSEQTKKENAKTSTTATAATAVKQPKPATNGAALDIELGEHICLIGNGLGERLQHRNHWESLLHQSFADKELTVRNLCFPGDTVDVRLRSLNFGTPDQHLTHSGATAILFFFGGNESFDGKAGLESFTRKLDKLVEETKTKSYSKSKTSPKIVLVSPTAFENTGDKNLPDGTTENQNLEMYSAAMASVAKKHGVGFADLFKPTQELFKGSDERMTLDGFQLNDAGYQALAPVLNKSLFGGVKMADAVDAKVKSAVDDKNFHWWHRYRAVNGFSIYGTRGKAGSDGTYNNEDVMERERTILDQMTANRDKRIWALASGDSVPNEIDDSNTLPFINPKTNVGGPNDKQAKAGKLGSLDYRPAADQVSKFKLADGYEINVFATEEDFPELANPVALNFDAKGRMWVTTMPSYPHWKPKTKLDDKLLILTDSDSDGRADDCKVFADGLYVPTGFELGHGGVYVAQQPDILFIKDTDGDDKADTRTRVVTGLGTADSHHGTSAFEWGPGGGLYFCEGTFKYTQVETPYGPQRLNEAGIWRHDPRTQNTHVHVNYAFANPWGHVFDKWGQNFIADASGGQHYWATLISGKVNFPAKHPGGSHYKRTLGIPKGKKIPDAPKLLKKRIRPTSGCEIVSSSHFPPEAQGNYLFNNVISERAILNHTMTEKGSGFFCPEIEPLLNCDDGNFRPVDIQFGPDGALYIVDWHNALIGHLQHNLREPNRDHSHGRIWRITYKGRPLVKPPKIDGEPISNLVKLLNTPDDRNRYRVKRELAARDTDAVIPEVKKWMESLDTTDAEYERMMLEGLWQYQTHNIVNQELLETMLNAKDYHARAAATRVLSYWHDRVPNAVTLVKQRISDDSALVRAEAVRAASFLSGDEIAEGVLDVLNFEADENMNYLLEETMKVLQPE
ncbi:MAG: PVC-type heme-binding CxxCH protein [Mariniblastus sp.]